MYVEREASGSERVVAAITDAAAVYGWVVVVAIGDAFLGGHVSRLLSRLPYPCGLLVAYGIPVSVLIVDGTVKNASFGMQRKGLMFGGVTTPEVSRLRVAARLIVGVLCVPLFPVSFVLCFVHGRHRSVADLICSTVVYATESDDRGPRGFDVVMHGDGGT